MNSSSPPARDPDRRPVTARVRRASARKHPTRIQREKTEAILAAALDVFAAHGYSGATLDQLAEAAGLSKPNLLYYFASKDEVHRILLERLLDTWLEPLRQLDAEGDPRAEIGAYVQRKLGMARDYPRESRLFAGEILAGAPRIADQISGPLKDLVDEKAAVIRGWAQAGRISDVDPHHLIFSIWAVTQHYADFESQIGGILGPPDAAHFTDASRFVAHLFNRAIAPEPGKTRAGSGPETGK